MTWIPGRAKSPQSWIRCGLPLRTTKTIVEVNGALLSGSRDCQSTGSSFPRSEIASMS